MPSLPDGTVIPSFLGVQSMGVTGDPGNQTNTSLRWGEVISVTYPGDPQNINQRRCEYTVRVQHKDGDSAGAATTYKNVQVANYFGGGADYLNYTLRTASQNSSGSPSQLGNGSKVLLLCINGDKHQAQIVSGVWDYGANQDQDMSAVGHHLRFKFNGMVANIDDDGQFFLTYTGKTSADGSPADSVDENSQFSSLTFVKDGSIRITGPDKLQSIYLDNRVEGNHILDLVGDAAVNIHSNGVIYIIGPGGVQTGAATDATMLGTTYRANEMQMNTQLVTQAQTISGLLQAAGALIETASASNATPIVGGALAAPQFAAAAAALQSAASAMTAWATAIQAFETQSSVTPYISAINFSD